MTTEHNAPFHDKDSAIAFMDNVVQIAKNTFDPEHPMFYGNRYKMTALRQPGPINVVQVGAVGDFPFSAASL